MAVMYYVMTIDQRRSQAGPDAVPAAEELLAGSAPVRAFERTAGDEIQGLLDDPGAVVRPDPGAGPHADLVRSG